MVDGPRGPYHEVKKGAIALSIETEIPIVPVNWYSEDKSFKEMNSWDKMKFPVGKCRIINLYGKPIYPDGKSEEELTLEVKNSLFNLEQKSPQKYKQAIEAGIWKNSPIGVYANALVYEVVTTAKAIMPVKIFFLIISLYRKIKVYINVIIQLF